MKIEFTSKTPDVQIEEDVCLGGKVIGWVRTRNENGILRCHAASLSGQPERRLRLEGHTDERGTPDYSLVFGERRAKRARQYLIEELGVAADRIVSTSYGKERPVCRQHRPACWQRNRRVHVVVQEP